MTPFLRHPGRPGPFGALMDETARAADDFCRRVETFDAARFLAERPSPDPNCRSPRTIAFHAVYAALGYANYIRQARGIAFEPRERMVTIEQIASPADVRPLFVRALHYTEDALEGAYDMTDEQNRALEFQVRWGPRYDPEMILEHGVCHLLRHRRQLDRWGG